VSAPQQGEKPKRIVSEIRQFFRDHGISEVEAIIPDMAGIARGKIMPAEKFAEDGGMRLPESVFLQTVTGDYPPETGDAMSPAEIDIVLKADQKTVRRVPWAAEPTAQVIHDCFYSDGRRVSMAPRHVLRNVLELYAQRGWEPVVAPELEFYLVEQNRDADYPLKPPVGRSGRSEPCARIAAATCSSVPGRQRTCRSVIWPGSSKTRAAVSIGVKTTRALQSGASGPKIPTISEVRSPERLW